MLTRPRLGRPARALLLVLAVLAALSATTALAASSTVKVEDNFFSARKLSVSHGATVQWKWTGSLYHNVVVKSGPAKFASRRQLGGTFSHRFTKRGTYKLYCTLHPNMTMTVTVR